MKMCDDCAYYNNLCRELQSADECPFFEKRSKFIELQSKWENTSDYGFLDVYNIGPEFVVSPKVLQGRIDVEEHSKILEQLNGTYTINFEPSKDSLQDIIDYIIKELDKANG